MNKKTREYYQSLESAGVAKDIIEFAIQIQEENERQRRKKLRKFKKFKKYVSNHQSSDDDFVIKTRFGDDSKPVCPHCWAKGKGVSKKGKTSTGKQRFICQHCHKTFIATTNCAMHNSKRDFSVWRKFIYGLLNKNDLNDIAYDCKLSKLTAWRWRHKICTSFLNIINSEQKNLCASMYKMLTNYPAFKLEFANNQSKRKALKEEYYNIIFLCNNYHKSNKYFNNYAAWYFLVKDEKLSPKEKNRILKLVCSDPCYTKVRDIGNKPATPAP